MLLFQAHVVFGCQNHSLFSISNKDEGNIFLYISCMAINGKEQHSLRRSLKIYFFFKTQDRIKLVDPEQLVLVNIESSVI